MPCLWPTRHLAGSTYLARLYHFLKAVHGLRGIEVANHNGYCIWGMVVFIAECEMRVGLSADDNGPNR